MVEEKTTEMQDEIKTEKPKSFQKFVKIISIILFIATIVVLIIIANVSESFSLKPALIIGGISLVFFGVIFFSFELRRLFKNKATEQKESLELPSAITENQAYEIVESKFKTKNYADYIEEIYSGGAEIRGKNPGQWIFSLYFKTLYSEQKYFVGLNMHYPDKLQIILNPTATQRLTAKKRLATDPEEAPDIEEVTTYNPSLGLSTIQKKITPKRKTKEETKLKGDLQ